MWPGVPKRAQSFGSIYNSWMETEEENKSIYLRHSVCSNWYSRNGKFSMGNVEKQNTVFQKHSHLIKCLWSLHYSWCDVAVLQSTLIKPKMWTPVKALTLHHNVQCSKSWNTCRNILGLKAHWRICHSLHLKGFSPIWIIWHVIRYEFWLNI